MQQKKKTTAAVVIIDGDGTILGCHATGRPEDSGFDFPKGIVEEKETDIHAALRELEEETGIVLFENELIDCGVYPHNKEKNIHIFIRKVEKLPPVGILFCNSYFTTPYGKQVPEIDCFRHIRKEEQTMFNKVLHDKFEIIDEFCRKEESAVEYADDTRVINELNFEKEDEK